MGYVSGLLFGANTTTCGELSDFQLEVFCTFLEAAMWRRRTGRAKRTEGASCQRGIRKPGVSEPPWRRDARLGLCVGGVRSAGPRMQRGHGARLYLSTPAAGQCQKKSSEFWLWCRSKLKTLDTRGPAHSGIVKQALELRGG